MKLPEDLLEKIEKAPKIEPNKHRVGKFRIPKRFIHDREAKIIFSKCVPVRAEYMFYGDYIEYVAYSDLFEEIEEGCEPPVYEWEFQWTSGDITFNGFKKV